MPVGRHAAPWITSRSREEKHESGAVARIFMRGGPYRRQSRIRALGLWLRPQSARALAVMVA